MRRAHQNSLSDNLMDLISRTVDLMKEIDRQPRVLGRREGRTLRLTPQNQAGVTLVRVIAGWLNSPRDLSIMNPLDEFAVTLTYPPTYDGDIGEASGDRRDSERAGSAVKGEGIGERVSPSKYYQQLQETFDPFGLFLPEDPDEDA